MSFDIQPIKELGQKEPFIIAGPCSAETEEQVLAAAHGLKDLEIDYFRAGIWKPRTRPGSFEGAGKEALKWLQRVKEETGMKVITEVANQAHVFEAIKHKIDAVWLGARTTVNPFSVQEIADALQGIDIPVFIKNPVNPDLNLWIGAIERIYRAGITKIGVIHRGYTFHGESKYRNMPNWQLPIELKRRFPDLTLICDNSHICGNRELLLPVAQKALDLNYDGLMTEVHPTPDEAWSDAKQQITPIQFGDLLSNLILRNKDSADVEYQNHIDHLRHEIDELDEQLLQLLSKRMQMADEIGNYKRENNIAILQSDRWNEILERTKEKGKALGLSEEFVGHYLRALHEESINHQIRIMNKQAAK